jgi:hypothetical protein
MKATITYFALSVLVVFGGWQLAVGNHVGSLGQSIFFIHEYHEFHVAAIAAITMMVVLTLLLLVRHLIQIHSLRMAMKGFAKILFHMFGNVLITGSTTSIHIRHRLIGIIQHVGQPMSEQDLLATLKLTSIFAANEHEDTSIILRSRPARPNKRTQILRKHTFCHW